MKNSKISYLLLLIMFLLINCRANNNSLLKQKEYIENKFNIRLDSSYVVTTHKKEDVYNYWIQHHQSSKYAEKNLKTCNWRTNAEFFIDSVYSKNENGDFHGIFIDYFGDSLSGYDVIYYKHGKKDSIEMVYGCLGANKITHYKDGLKHGIYKRTNNDGSLSVLKKYDNGTLIDTTYEYYDNGNVMAKRYFVDGEKIWEKCFEEDGKTEMECDF